MYCISIPLDRRPIAPRSEESELLEATYVRCGDRQMEEYAEAQIQKVVDEMQHVKAKQYEVGPLNQLILADVATQAVGFADVAYEAAT